MSEREEIELRIEKAKGALLATQRHSWEQGLAMQAFLELGEMETVKRLAFESVNRSLKDGRLATIGVQDAITDHCSVGEALLAAIRETGDESFIKAEGKLRDWALHKAPRSQEGICYHLLTGEEFWVDSMYMLPPYLMAAGETVEALKQFDGYWEALFDKEAELFVHKWDNEHHFANDPTHWGLGNGWAEMTLARLIDALSGNETYREKRADYIKKAENLIDAVLNCRDERGRLHNALDDPNSYVEVAGMQMLAYTIYRGIRQGWLSMDYLGEADGLRMFAESWQDDYGFVHGVCGAPLFDKPGVSPEQQAIFVMMEHWYLLLAED